MCVCCAQILWQVDLDCTFDLFHPKATAQLWPQPNESHLHRLFGSSVGCPAWLLQRQLLGPANQDLKNNLLQWLWDCMNSWLHLELHLFSLENKA